MNILDLIWLEIFILIPYMVFYISTITNIKDLRFLIPVIIYIELIIIHERHLQIIRTRQAIRKKYKNMDISSEQREENRKNALKKVQPFLHSYNDIWGNICISNNNVKINLLKDKIGRKKITCLCKVPNKNGQKFFLSAKFNKKKQQYKSYDIIENIWDTICLNFTEKTIYENIVKALSASELDISEVVINADGVKKLSNEKSKAEKKNLLNINSATERELMALPGINVVTAKKILKYIEENNGFKTFEEFVKEIKIKENFINRIKSVTCIKPKADNNKELNDEKSSNCQEEIISNDDSAIMRDPQDKRIIDI